MFLVPQVPKEFRCCGTVPGIVIVAERENFQDFGIAHQRFEYLDPILQFASAVDDGLVPCRGLLLNPLAVSKPTNISEVRKPQCRKYWRGGTVGPFAVAGSRNILPLRVSAETTEQGKHLSPMNVSFRVLVFLLIAIGGTVVASRLVAPKKGVACCSAEVCDRKHHHE